MPCCCAPECRTRRSEAGFRTFRFPKDKTRRAEWLKYCNRDQWKPSTSSVICEAHFDDSQWELKRLDGWKKLKQNAVPTLFSFQNLASNFIETPQKTLHQDTNKENINPESMSSLTGFLNSNGQLYKYKTFSNDPAEEIVLSMTEANEIDALKTQIEELKQKFENELNKFRLENRALQKEVNTLQSDYEKQRDNLLKFLTDNQIASLLKGRMNTWSDETIIKCLKLRFRLGIDGYDFLHKTQYPMPSSRTLARRLQEYKVTPGILTNLLEPLKYKVECMEPNDRYCCLSTDEMQIAPSKDYNKHMNQNMGYVTLGNQKELGTHIMVALLRGTQSRWKQVIAVEVTEESVTGEHMQEFVTKCVQYSKNICGLYIIALTSDMGNNNMALWSVLGVNACRDGTVKNVVYFNGHPVLITPDVSHLLKNLKQAVQSQPLFISVERKDEEKLPTNIIDGKYIKVLWQAELRAEKPLRLLYHLKPEDISPTNWQKMDVTRAVRFFSNTTACGVEDENFTTRCFDNSMVYKANSYMV